MKTSHDILSELGRVIRLNSPNTEGLDIGNETLLREELGLDSLRLVQILVALESTFDFEFEVEDLDPRAFAKIGDLVDLTERTLGKAGAQ